MKQSDNIHVVGMLTSYRAIKVLLVYHCKHLACMGKCSSKIGFEKNHDLGAGGGGGLSAKFMLTCEKFTRVISVVACNEATRTLLHDIYDDEEEKEMIFVGR